jgi:hypothetical protein
MELNDAVSSWIVTGRETTTRDRIGMQVAVLDNGVNEGREEQAVARQL